MEVCQHLWASWLLQNNGDDGDDGDDDYDEMIIDYPDYDRRRVQCHTVLTCIDLETPHEV